MGKIKNFCPYCGGGSSLDVGPGRFRDFDSDFHGGIPICPCCGGLGWVEELSCDDFWRRTERIGKLRREYCPIGNLRRPALPAIVELEKLKELIREVTDLFSIYGIPEADCFAKEISSGNLNGIVEHLQGESENMANFMRSIKVEPKDKIRVLTKPALIAFFEGRFEDGVELFKEAIQAIPDNSIIYHDFGMILWTFFGDFKQARSYFKMALDREPKKILHYISAVKAMNFRRDAEDALRFIGEGERCSDATQEEILELQALEQEIIKESKASDW